MLYLSSAMRSTPMPNANPEYFLESMPHMSSTFGLTMPAPSTSIQPVPLHIRQPSPWQFAQVRSTSADGSVNGKNDGRKRVRMPSPYIWRANSSSVPFRSPMVMFSSMTRPSIWWNTGECVASASSAR